MMTDLIQGGKGLIAEYRISNIFLYLGSAEMVSSMAGSLEAILDNKKEMAGMIERSIRAMELVQEDLEFDDGYYDVLAIVEKLSESYSKVDFATDVIESKMFFEVLKRYFENPDGSELENISKNSQEVSRRLKRIHDVYNSASKKLGEDWMKEMYEA